MRKAKLILSSFILLSLLSSCKFVKQYKMFDKDEEVLEVKKEVPVVEEDTTNIVQLDTVEVQEEAVEVQSEPVVAEVDEEKNDSYYMVVGSFLNEELANKYAERLESDGYDSQVFFASSVNSYRVSAKSYKNFNVAVGEIENFRNSVTPRAWVHVKK